MRHEGSLTSGGGVPIWYWAHAVEGARAACLLVHGVGEHSGRYRHVAEALNQWGMTVWAVDYRGHGRAGGRRGHCGTFRELLDDVELVAARMRGEHPQVPAVLIGHSLGGLIVLALALDRPQTLRAVVASSPALALSLQPSPFKLLMAQLLGRLLPTLAVSNEVNPTWLSHDPAIVKAYQTDPLVHRKITLGGYLAIRDAMAEVSARATTLTVPCLILQAGDDHLVEAAASRQFAAAARSPGSAYREYAGFYHELFNEVGRAQVLDDLGQWLGERLN